MKQTNLFLAAALALAPLSVSEARAEPVVLDVALGKPFVLAGKKQSAFLKIGLTGKELARAEGRAPINLSIVLDRSSSMHGEKIEKAKEAALLVLDRLSSEDIVSIVTYDSGVEVLVPATKMTEAEEIRERIRSIEPRGSTALFAGVSKGIQELRKFLDRNRVNRVILMSDGQANVGPSSPNELGRLGAAAAKEGISVTTVGLGLGYNEDLMVQLAQSSDGNHAFAASGEELVKIFDYELGDVLSVIAQEISVKVRLPEGVRPLRILNRAGEIHGQEIVLAMNQLYQKQQKYVLLEVELPAGREGATETVANVDVSYANMDNGETERVSGRADVTFTQKESEVGKHENRVVMIDAVEALAVERNKDALALRDKGKVEEAKKVLVDNAAFLEHNARRYSSSRLGSYGTSNRQDADKLESRDWQKQRKQMKKKAHELNTQQSY
jgi:Ca-activated chloride channel family protein